MYQHQVSSSIGSNRNSRVVVVLVVLLVLVYYSRCYSITTIGGSTWTKTFTLSSDNMWGGIASNSNGSVMAAVVDGGGLYVSTSG